MVEQLKNLLVIFIGGGVGSCCRFLISKTLNPLFTAMPLGTLTANALSCLIMGFFTAWLVEKSTLDATYKMLVLVGFCGGFSTFSTFANEMLTLFNTGNWFRPALYALISITIGICCILLGMYLGIKWGK